MCASVSVNVLLLVLLAHVNLFTIASSTLNIHPLYQRLRRQSACNVLQYTCANGECIASYSVCDGSKECSDGSDETRAACRAVQIICPTLAFECGYGACIDRELKCNGKYDCADGSDEPPGCVFGIQSNSSCPAGNFQCSNGQCISQYSMCDGSLDCSDGSDETISLCRDLNCPSNSFKCAYGACLDKSVECNNKQDCPDNSDELNCNLTPTTTEASPPSIFGGCRLPSQPENGEFVSISCSPRDSRDMCLNKPGAPVPDKWLLKYKCNPNYNLNSQDNYEFSICDSGIWKSPLKCIKLCPALVSTSLDIECFYKGQEVPCGNQMKPNTTAKAKCKQHYKEIYNRQYNNLACLESGQWDYPLFYCLPDCGISTKIEGTNIDTVEALITSGVSSHRGQFPWLAAIFLKNDSYQLWEQQCGGTLITPHIVLTAAHCLMPADVILAPENIKVGLGKYHRDFYRKENYSSIVDVKEVIVPRFYSGRASYFALDIGLIDLKISVQVTAYIMPACVDWASSVTISSGSTGYVAGWGTTENRTSSEVVLSTQLTYINYSQCINTVRRVYKSFITHDKFCATPLTPDGGQVDRGDSGGGMTIVDKGQHTVIGVVSTKIVQERGLSLFTDLSNVEVHIWLEQEKRRLDKLHNES